MCYGDTLIKVSNRLRGTYIQSIQTKIIGPRGEGGSEQEVRCQHYSANRLLRRRPFRNAAFQDFHAKRTPLSASQLQQRKTMTIMADKSQE